MRVEVTAEDIEKAKNYILTRNAFTHCPVALALKRISPGDKEVWAGGSRARVRGALVFLPQEVRKFIDDFDDNKEVKPFSFELEI